MLQVMRLCGLAFLFLGFCLSGCVSAWYSLLQCCQLPYSSRPPGRGRKREISLIGQRQNSGDVPCVFWRIRLGPPWQPRLWPPVLLPLPFAATHSSVSRDKLTCARPATFVTSVLKCTNLCVCCAIWTNVNMSCNCVCVCMLVAFFALLLCASAF